MSAHNPFTDEWLAGYQARRVKLLDVVAKIPDDTPDDGPESTLQADCEKWLKERGWVFVHVRDARGCRKGILDLIVAAPEGRTVWLELKSRGGRLTKEQKLEIMMLQHLRHEVHKNVRSFRRFVACMTERGEHD